MLRNGLILLLLLLLGSVAYGQRARRNQPQPHPQPQSVTAPAAPKQQSVAVPAQPPEIKKQAEDPEAIIWAGLYTAEVHRRYHTTQAIIWWASDLLSKVVITVLSVFSFIGPLMFPGKKASWRDWTWRTSGLAVLLAALWMSYISFNDWYHEQSDLADKWMDLAGEWRDAELKLGASDHDGLMKLIAQLEDQQAAIEKASPKSHNPWMLEVAQNAENKHLGITQ